MRRIQARPTTMNSSWTEGGNYLLSHYSDVIINFGSSSGGWNLEEPHLGLQRGVNSTNDARLRQLRSCLNMGKATVRLVAHKGKYPGSKFVWPQSLKKFSISNHRPQNCISVDFASCDRFWLAKKSSFPSL